MPSIKIAPSILSADFANLARDCTKVIEDGADWLHVDIMDGHFVNNLTIGAPVVNSMRKNLPNAYLDCHLMVDNPEKYVEELSKCADSFTFHIEAPSTVTPLELVAMIKEKGMKAGISIKPKTPASSIDDELLAQLDMVLVMTVEPGFGGQSFMADACAKCTEIRERKESIEIQVDGGISPKTISEAAKLGANNFVAGSAVFCSENWSAVIAEMKKLAAEQ